MKPSIDKLDVWIWRPGQRLPVAAGRLTESSGAFSFRYDRAFLGLPEAMPVFDRDLPIDPARRSSQPHHALAPSLRDALPDRWGRRAIAAGLQSEGFSRADADEIDEFTLMLRTGPDRIGGLEFCLPDQRPASENRCSAHLEMLARLVDSIERDEPVPAELRQFIPCCASVGGARPKALYTDPMGQRFIAKFTAGEDFPFVQAEFVAMRLAQSAGIRVAPVHMERIDSRPILLVMRFDRQPHPVSGEHRLHMVSALTWTQVDEISAHHISYPQLAEIMDVACDDPVADKIELFTRILFNILVGNTDDHARNHAGFWDGKKLRLTPGYDISPQRRNTRSANLAMALTDGARSAQLVNAAGIAQLFGVTGPELRRLVERLVGAIRENWIDVCDEAGLSNAEHAGLAGRQFFNEYGFEGFGSTPRLC